MRRSRPSQGDLAGFAFNRFDFYVEFLEPNAARGVDALQHQYGRLALFQTDLAWSESNRFAVASMRPGGDWTCAA